MKRKFKVTVEGETFVVEVEELTEGGGTPRREVAGAQEPAVNVKVEAEPSKGRGEGEIVSAPLPGVILDVKVAKGDWIKAGSVLLVLESMKMENEVYAPVDGVVAELHVKVGQKVARGERLVLIS